MVSPNLIKKKSFTKAVEINDDTKKLFQIIYNDQTKKEESNDSEPKIRVSELISRLAFFYEKIRNAVDYDEENLIRKNAIARILRRHVIIEGTVKDVDSEGLANYLLIELIRGGYLPNNQIPETRIKEVAILLNKYLSLKEQLIKKINSSLGRKVDLRQAEILVKEKNKVIRWILSIAACEIEESLSPNKVKQMVVNNMFDVLTKEITLPKDMPYEDDLEIQIYLSIGRKYLNLDREILSFILFKYYNDDWLNLNKAQLDDEDQEKIKKIADNIKIIRTKITEQLNHPLAKQLDKIVRRYSLYYNVLTETISENPVKVYSELQKGESSFLNLARNTCEKKYSKAKARLWRAAIRSIIYIFLTKSIFVILIEVPAIKFFNEPINYVSLGINVMFPAALLFLIVQLTQKPRKDNTEKIIAGIREIAFLGESKRQATVLRRSKSRSLFASVAFNLIYSAAFIFSVYIIVIALEKLGFNWVSILIFLFFLAFVSFFSVVVTRGVKDLMIVERRENIGTFLVDLFYMPIILVGRWLSNKMSRLNIFVFIFDFIIEAPFKILVNVAEDWTKYVRERRDNME
ncbi:MAG: hypothetical protein ACOX0H_01325 [Patescibacteria group bacterium]|jgi:hypothetical protein|nr:hypothetical protein [bacterium]